MSKKLIKKWTADELVKRIRTKYEDAGSCVVYEQVASGTGVYANSWVDAASIDLWPSRGFTRRAFEVKVSRADFLSELKNPAKNAWCREYFHEFWFVAPAEVIVDVNELPENTGWLCPRGHGLTIKRAASHREDPSLDDCFFAALCRAGFNEDQRAKNDLRDDLLRTDTEIREAMACYKGCSTFLRGFGLFGVRSDNPEDWVKQLKEATKDKEAAAEVEQLQEVARLFEGRIEQLLLIFCQIAHMGILARDEAGDFLVKTYGEDKERIYGESSKKLKAAMREFLDDAQRKEND